MKRKLLNYNLLTAGTILTLIGSNPMTSYVYATEITTSEQSTSETTISEEDIDAYFEDCVFVGDSIMLGFRNYSMKQKDSFLNKIQFLAAGNFSARNALWDVTEKSVHPVYQGKKRQIWESISMMEAKKVFLFFGMNDLNLSGLEGTCENYAKVIHHIKELNPEIEIHIISMTYTVKGADTGLLNNTTIREFNTMLQNMAAENGWGYMDLATPLSDENGDLASIYCSDEYVHHSKEAYQVWTTVIRNYAKSQLNSLTNHSVDTPITETKTEMTILNTLLLNPTDEIRLTAGFSADLNTITK